MATLSNLYPPIVLDVLPAFIRTNDCKIYFSFSKYNSRENIQSVQISLINQRTNASAFRTDWYPTGIKITDVIGYDPDHGDYNYYVTINQKDLVNSDLGTDRIFGPNQFYKIQLRFTERGFIPPKKEIDGNSFYEASANWLYENRNHFSEWSKVCLIKGISEPILQIHGFNNVISDNQETIFTSPIIDVIGELQIDSNENEYLKSYNIKIYQTENQNNILLDSGQIYTNSYNPNEINYEITYNLLDGIKYTLSITYTTNNLYSNTINYNFTVIQYNIVEKLNADIIATPDEENGRMKVDIIAKDTSDFIGSFTIRRSSSESNFHTWEDVKTITYETRGILNYTWYDITIKSGVWYKYCAQRRNSVGDRSVIIQTAAPKMCLFNDIFLTAGDRQLRIKFNPSLNEFKYNVSESQQVTIGSKFPYIKRNGANYFRTFPLGGLISSFMDTSNWYDPHYYDGEFHPEENEIKAFSSKATIYGSNQEYYNNYNNQNNISEYNDYIYEREFREKVYDFLYQHSVKLFRSTTEGNILIKLMNIDFQPIESLGRRLYSFTATAVEVDEANISNYDKYNIQKIGEYDTYILYQHEVLGQISGTFTQGDGDILSGKINSKHSLNATEGFINKISGLKSLKLEIESEPYVIIEDATGRLIKANSNSNIDINNATQGYIVVINGQEIIIPSRMIRHSKNPGDTASIPEIIYSNFFELKDNNTLITSLSFKYPTTATIDYTAILAEVEDTSKLTSEVYYYHKVGQLYDIFNPQDSLIQKIYNKYAINNKKFYQQLANINGIRIESAPNAVIYIKDSQDSDLNRHVLENGFLQIMDEAVNIEGLYFFGMHFTKNDDEQENINRILDNKYILMNDEQHQSFSEIINPIPNGVYKVSSYYVNNAISFNNANELLTVTENNVMINANKNYALLMQDLYENSGNLYIYYMNNWYPFIPNDETLSSGDVLCPVEGLIDYFCEVIRGNYRNVT